MIRIIKWLIGCVMVFYIIKYTIILFGILLLLFPAGTISFILFVGLVMAATIIYYLIKYLFKYLFR